MSEMFIEGVFVHEVKTHQDDRGFFREIARIAHLNPLLPIGQISHSLVHTGIVKAWHGHRNQGQWNYVINGFIKVVLYDARPSSPTCGAKMELLCGDGRLGVLYYFPPGVLHGYRCIEGPMNILYLTTGEYDPSDEIRLAHDELSIGYKWHEQSKY